MLNVTAFLDELQTWRLLDPAQCEELSRALQGRNIGPRTLACELIERGWLTPFQASQVHQGRGQDLLFGSYVLLERLGEGGMGAVFKARNWKLGQVVAIKFIRKERLSNPDSVRRFQREIRAAALLRHPNIVHALDANEVGGSHVLVMEYVEGIDLDKLVQDKGPLPASLAREYARQTALALAHAHEKGMVHRDIKPSNLLRTPEGQIKLLDLGLARFQAGGDGDRSSTMTASDVIMGTPDFLAPEQARRSHDVDIRADLYSLGCTLYFLLSGRVPFPGGTIAEKLVQHQLDEPEPLEQLQPGIPPSLAAVARKLMAKKPEQRYQNPAEAAEALSRCVEPISATLSAALENTLVSKRPAGGEPEKTVTYEPFRPQAAPSRRGRLWLLILGAIVLAGLGLAGLLLRAALG